MDHYDLIVVGAGVSGLTLAAQTASGGRLSVLVLEKEQRLGGCLQTWRLDSGFWVELGAHTAYNSYQNLLLTLKERRGLDGLVERRTLGYRYLDGQHLQAPLARLNWGELLLNLPLGLLRARKKGASLSEYYGALFGRRNYARMLAPAFAAVLSQPAEAFPAQWLFRRKARLQAAPRKYTWIDGLQGIAEALADAAPFEVRLGTVVNTIRRRNDGYEVRTQDRHWHCHYLALATPVDVAAHLLRDAHLQLAGLLRTYPMADIESLAVVVPAQRVRLPELAGLIGIDDAFYSVVSRDPLPHPTLRGFTFHFRPRRLDAQAKLERICEVLGIHAQDIVAQREVNNRLPALSVAHVERVAEIDACLQGTPLLLTGNYFQGLSIGDCADRSVREADRLLQAYRGKETQHG